MPSLVTLRDPGRRRGRRRSARSSTPPSRPSTAAQKAHPELRVEQFGGGSSEEEFKEVFEADLQEGRHDLAADHAADPARRVRRAGRRRDPAAAGDHRRGRHVGPRRPAQPAHRPSTTSINHVILLIGLAVGVDYALFYLRRVREERAAGRSNDAAIEAAAATSGRAVLISGITVMIAMAGMYLARRADVHLVRDRHDRRRRRRDARLAHGAARACCRCSATASTRAASPASRRLKRRMAAFGLWSRDRRPRHAPPAAVGRRSRSRCCVALAHPGAAAWSTGTPGIDALPQDLAGRADVRPRPGRVPERDRRAQRRRQGRGRHGAGRAGGHRRSSSDAARAHTALFPGRGPSSQDVNPDKTVAIARRWRSPATGRTSSPSRALDALRDDLVPATLGKVGGARGATSTGGTASDRDFNDTMTSHLPLVFGFVIIAAFLLLLVTFRSIVVPIKAIVAEPAVGGRRLRRAGAGLPARLVQEPARLPDDRPDRGVDAAVPVRGPVRPVDGLPRVHPQPGPRALRPRHEDRRRRRARRSRARPAW